MATPKPLHIAEFGNPEGRPLVFFHGFPGSHLQGKVLEPYAGQMHLRVLAVDRPGYGLSEPQPGASLPELMRSVSAALDDRHVDKFFVVGLSGGSPAAMATAAFFGSRVIALGDICGMAPFTDAPELFYKFARTGLGFAKRAPEFLVKAIITRFLKDFEPAKRFDEMIERLDEVDQRVLRQTHVREALLASVELARRHGPEGVLFDMRTMIRPWPSSWSEVRCPVALWHGGKDRILAASMAEFVKGKLPQAKLKIYPDEGHYSLPIQRASEILKDLVSLGPTQ